MLFQIFLREKIMLIIYMLFGIVALIFIGDERNGVYFFSSALFLAFLSSYTISGESKKNIKLKKALGVNKKSFLKEIYVGKTLFSFSIYLFVMLLSLVFSKNINVINFVVNIFLGLGVILFLRIILLPLDIGGAFNTKLAYGYLILYFLMIFLPFSLGINIFKIFEIQSWYFPIEILVILILISFIMIKWAMKIYNDQLEDI